MTHPSTQHPEDRGFEELESILADAPDTIDYTDPREANTVRANYARIGLTAYATTTGTYRNESVHTALRDMLGDLRHLADAIGLDWEAVSAPNRYDDEIAEAVAAETTGHGSSPTSKTQISPDTGATVVYDFPADHGEVHMRLSIRWEDDPEIGPGTVWWADFDRPPYRLDGESNGLLTENTVKELAADQHRTAPRDSVAPVEVASAGAARAAEKARRGSIPSPIPVSSTVNAATGRSDAQQFGDTRPAAARSADRQQHEKGA